MRVLLPSCYNKGLAGIKEQEDRVKEAYEYEIDRINATMVDGVEKERAVREAQAKTFSQTEQLRAKEREEKRRQAQFDKAMAITQIIVNTAAAVVTALLDPKAPLIKAAAVGAAGAAQLAVAAAAPIPAYAVGDPEGKTTGGLALVGEKEPELIVEGNGNAYMVNKPTVKDLPKRTKIFNQEQISELFAGLNAPSLAAILNQKQENKNLSKEIGQHIRQSTKEMVRELKQNRPKKSVVKVNLPDPYYNRMVKGRA